MQGALGWGKSLGKIAHQFNFNAKASENGWSSCFMPFVLVGRNDKVCVLDKKKRHFSIIRRRGLVTLQEPIFSSLDIFDILLSSLIFLLMYILRRVDIFSRGLDPSQRQKEKCAESMNGIQRTSCQIHLIKTMWGTWPSRSVQEKCLWNR